jgi:hypothetical protein
MSSHSNESDSDNVHQPKDGNIETGSSDQHDGMRGAEGKSDEQEAQTQAQSDPTTATTDTVAKATMTTSGHPGTADLNHCYTLPSGELADAKNTLRSNSVATSETATTTTAATATTAAVTSDHRENSGSLRSAGDHSQPTHRSNFIPASSNPNSLLGYKDQVRRVAHDNRPSQRVPVQMTGMNESHTPNITLGGNQKQLMLIDSFNQNENQAILPPTGNDEQLPVYKDQAIPGRDTHYNASAEQGLTRGSSAGAVAIVPTRRAPFAPPNPQSLPTTEIQEHLLVATVVPDSVVDAASSNGNVVMAVPLTGRYW